MTAQAIVSSPVNRRPVGYWLVAIAALVFAMVLLGGATRLTHSGLSIVEWQPVTGTVPPLDQATWQAEFAKYQHFPEYRKLNNDMTLDEFKRIYWVEYVHRLLGRLIGVAFVLPFLYFLWAGCLDRAFALQLAAILVLGGAQGAVGWFMVQSGLVDDPAVSHYRLTAHLGLAVILYGCILWTAFGLLAPFETRRGASAFARATGALVALVFFQILAGGLVAGLHAGLIYNSWPLMDGAVIPLRLFDSTPWWRNPLENIAAVQFDHRMLAYVIALSAMVVGWVSLRSAAAARRQAAAILLATVLVQLALGIATLLLAVPVPLAIIHQGGALAVFTAALWLHHTTRQT